MQRSKCACAIIHHGCPSGPSHATAQQLIPSYYDNYGRFKACNDVHGGRKWSDYVLDGTTACGKSIRTMKSNAIVAMNVTWLNERGIAARTDDLCGREWVVCQFIADIRLQLFRGGKQISIPDGPFFLWEGCQACATLPRVDLSVMGYVAVSGDDQCLRGTVPGIEVRMMDNYIHRGSLSSAGRLGADSGAVILAAILGFWLG